MRFLVTRPLEDAQGLKARLEAAGHSVILAPMMRIRNLAATIDLRGVQALLFTSANGVRAFAAQSAERDIPAYAVGAATAAEAERQGFSAVHVSGGDAAALANDVIMGLNPAGGPLFHAAGSVVRGDLGRRLTDAGFTYRKSELYTAEEVRELAAAPRQALAAGDLDAVLLYSPRTARFFLERVRQAGLTSTLANLDALCLSPAVADALAGSIWRQVLVAARPDEATLLALAGPV